MANTKLTPTTELQAVNQMLGTILEAPINSLVGVTSLDAQTAINYLAEVSRAVQQHGWHFNTEVNYPLAPDAFTGEIKLPANCLSVDSTGADQGLDVVARGNRLYDRGGHTFKIGKVVRVDMTILLPFADLPEVARRLIAVKACRLFQARSVGSTTLEAFTEKDEREAQRAFNRVVGKTADHNIFNSPDMQRMLRR